MDRVPETLRIEPAAWSGEVARLLARAIPKDDPHGLFGLHDDVQAQRAALIGVWAGQRLAGVYACRLDRFACGAELVIVAASGRLPGVSLTASVLPAIEATARGLGASAVRVHTRRPGLRRVLARYGYAETEVVLTKGLSSGRQE